MRDTLLLDQGYQPLKVISWQRAICMHFVGKVEVLSCYDWPIRTVSERYTAPAVVRLLRRVRAQPLLVRFSRENVYLRDGHQCQYCAKQCTHRELTLDHVMPRSRGGKTNWKNVVTACVKCNRAKGRKTPEEADMPLLNEPTRPRWVVPKVYTMGNKQVPDSWLLWLH